MIRYKISIEYNGNNFHGWQKQPNATTIQETLEEAIYKISQEKVTIVCAGRTDAGVHAIEQVAHFDMIKDFDEFKLQQAVNFYLKGCYISIFKVKKFFNQESFHARFSAEKRSYLYKILNRRNPPTFAENLSWWVPVPLDVKNMEKASKVLLGTHDFSSFRAQGCQARSAIRTINELNFEKSENTITMHIQAPSFLYHQVRNIIGTLYFAGLNTISSEDLKKILEAKDRKQAGITAPPSGLYFHKVFYKNIF